MLTRKLRFKTKLTLLPRTNCFTEILHNKNYTGIVQGRLCWTVHGHKIIISAINYTESYQHGLNSQVHLQSVWCNTLTLPRISRISLQQKQVQRHSYKLAFASTEINILPLSCKPHYIWCFLKYQFLDSGEHTEFYILRKASSLMTADKDKHVDLTASRSKNKKRSQILKYVLMKPNSLFGMAKPWFLNNW